MKKLLTVLLTALMVVTLGVVNIAAEGEETETVAAEVLENAGTEEVVLEETKENAIEPNPIDLAVDPEPLDEALEYDGKEHSLVKPGYDEGIFPVIPPLYGYSYALVDENTTIEDLANVSDWLNYVPKAVDAGTYYVAWIQYGLTYGVTYDSGIIEVTIAQKEVTATAIDDYKIYGYKDPLELGFTVEGLLEGHILDLDVARADGEDAGEYEIYLSNPVVTDFEGNDVTNNYDITTVDGIFTIEKAKIEIDTEPFTEAIINADTNEAEFIVDNYEELEDALGEVKFVDTDGEEIPYEVITLYPGTAQSRRVASIKLNVENGIKQVILLDNKNYKGAKGLIVRPGVLMVTATDLKFKKGSKKDRTININVEVKEAPEENYFGEPYVTVDGKQIALDTDFVFTEEGNVKLLGTYLKTLDHGDHKFVLHNAYEFPGVCVESNIHVSHNTNNDDTVRIVSTGIE